MTNPAWAALLALLGALATAYLAAATRARRQPRGWSGWRSAGFVTGLGLVALALSPGLAGSAHHDLRAHMVQHLAIGMYAPLALVLAAPVTLTLRNLPPARRRWVGPVLRSRQLHLLGHPVTAALLTVGGLYLIYLTPVYAAMHTEPLVRDAVHLHLFAAGYLLAWALVGPDPAPRRPGRGLRVVVLVVAAAGHAVLAKLLYARAAGWPQFAGMDPATIEDAAQLMYYGGDLAEVLLAAALFAGWYHRRRPAPIRAGRFTDSDGGKRVPNVPLMEVGRWPADPTQPVPRET